ncbi:MAG: hypothetical protein EXX96DRAFT_536027 [Benjaminiella poitrasii]|nr:MAG: hypothetical protein EXX96DRAFT_536027 [Benjaminiella poitrasii]
MKNLKFMVQEHNFWYCICKLVLGQRITDQEYINRTVALTFDVFATVELSIKYPIKKHRIEGYGDAMSGSIKDLDISKQYDIKCRQLQQLKVSQQHDQHSCRFWPLCFSILRQERKSVQILTMRNQSYIQ